MWFECEQLFVGGGGELHDNTKMSARVTSNTHAALSTLQVNPTASSFSDPKVCFCVV